MAEPVTPLGARNRLLVYVAAIACWIVLWVGAMAVGLELGKTIAGPQGDEGYLAFTGIWGVLLIPMGFGCSMMFLWRKRNILLFLVSAVPIGLAIMLWPFLPIPVSPYMGLGMTGGGLRRGVVAVAGGAAGGMGGGGAVSVPSGWSPSRALRHLMLGLCLVFQVACVSRDDVRRVPSPGYPVDAVLVELNGGATSSFSYEVHIVARGSRASRWRAPVLTIWSGCGEQIGME